MSSDAVTYAVEAVIGAGCLVAAAGSRRRSAPVWLTVLLVVAGVAAVIHAIVALAG